MRIEIIWNKHWEHTHRVAGAQQHRTGGAAVTALISAPTITAFHGTNANNHTEEQTAALLLDPLPRLPNTVCPTPRHSDRFHETPKEKSCFFLVFHRGKATVRDLEKKKIHFQMPPTVKLLLATKSKIRTTCAQKRSNKSKELSKPVWDIWCKHESNLILYLKIY